MSKKVWNLKFVVGNTKRFITDDSSPMTRSRALEGYDTIAGKGWPVWVEHVATGKRIAESNAEKQRQEKAE